jgi:hypothetical protein
VAIVPGIMAARRFPPPWTAEEIAGGYVVRDANKQALAYVYCREPEHAAFIAKVLTRDEARRIASNIAKLPQLVKRDE